MREIRYADAGMDMKKLGLCFMRKCWLVVVAAVAGAVLGGVLYTLAAVVPEAEREYQAMSKVYLDFEVDETGEVYQQYNGYTWNDLMATDPILDVTMKYLPEDYSREEVMAATKAEILSDLRLLTITITTHDMGRCNAILKATGQSLTDLGDTAKEFRQISVIQTTAAEPVTADDRTVQAVIAGVVAAMVLTLLGMMFYYVLDDRIMTAGDLKQVTDVPFIGYAGVSGRFGADYEENLDYLREKGRSLCVIMVAQGRFAELEGQHMKAANAQGKHAGQISKKAAEAVGRRVENAQGNQAAIEVPVEWNAEKPVEKWNRLCAAGHVVLVVDYGKVHAAYLAYVMEQIRLRECRIAGIAIGGADEKFLRRYYGHAFGRADKA